MIDKEKKKIRQQRYRTKHLDIIRSRQRERYRLNKDRLASASLIQYRKNRDDGKSRNRKSQAGLEKAQGKWRMAYRNRTSTIAGKILCSLRSRLRGALKGVLKADITMNLVGCSLDVLLSHLESQFLSGMSWKNYGVHGWHIDHIRPCYLFDFGDINQQKECFHFKNLRPLWAKDNLSRSKA